jgi:hypothetical protein
LSRVVLRRLVSGGMSAWIAAIDDALHLFAVPVAGVGQQHLGRVIDAGGSELALRGIEHRLKVPEVGADGLDLGGQHDLVLVRDGLRVVALQEAAQALDDT